MKTIVTTTQSMEQIQPAMAQFIEESQLQYVPRNRMSLEKLMKEHEADGVVVWENHGPVLYSGGEVFFFHPSMAKCRIAAYRKKWQPDLMTAACHLQKGDSFLDCTLGMGADAITASYFSEYGQVTGLESQTLIAGIIRWGMKLYHGQMPWLDQAVNRVEVINTDHRSYLAQMPDDAYDIIYFDPMFSRPLLNSQPISPLRKLANHDPVDLISIKEACRVARKCVVMKTLGSSDELTRLGFENVPGSRHNPITYGTIQIT